MIRWGIRLFRAEWREQLVVLGLLTTAVAAAVGIATAVHVVSPAAQDATFGAATHRYTLDNVDPADIDATIVAARDWFADVQAIPRGEVRIDGRGDAIAARVQDPAAPLGAPMLALLEGRYPTEPGELAVSDPLAGELGVAAESVLTVDGGVEMAVVGVVENPNSRSDLFILASPDFADGVSSVTLLVDAGRVRAEAFRGIGDPTPVYADRGRVGALEAVAVLGLIEVAFVMVALIAAAGFIAIAQRRQRQLGMLAAIGAVEQHLRMVTITNGAVVGAAAGVFGAVLGLLGWFLVAPTVGDRAGIRLERLDTPWWLAAIGVLAVATTTAAAWWPARIVARVPITQALAGRRPRPSKPGASLALSGGFVAFGLVALSLAGDVFSPTRDGVAAPNAILVVGGAIAIVVGVLLLGPYLVGLLAILADRFWLPVRIAFRDLGRYQSRSGSALAAVSLALGVPLAVTVAVATERAGPEEGNLGSDQILVTPEAIDAPFDAPIVTERSEAEQQHLDERVREIAVTLPGAVVTPLDKVFDPLAEPTQFGLDGIRVERSETGEKGDFEEDGPAVFVATPELLNALNIAEPAAGTDVLTTLAGELTYRGVIDPSTGRHPPVPVANPSTIAASYESLPSSLLTPEALAANGWATVRAGWLIQTDRPLATAEVAELRARTLSAGLAIETRNHQRGLAQLGAIATAIGSALALGILAMAVGLLRSEATNDLRTMTATGATSFTRRAISASTAASLAFLGVLLAGAGAYAGLSAATGDMPATPGWNLLATIVGVPSLAGVAGWLVSGRQPSALTHNPLSP